MELVRRDPFHIHWPLSGSRFFDWPEMVRWSDALQESEEQLRVEEFAENGSLVVRAEMPGIDPDKDVQIDISDGMLHIRAERRKETKEEKRDYFRKEIRYGAFSRALPLAPGVGEADVKATYKDGILEVRLPAAEEKPKTKISISRK